MGYIKWHIYQISTNLIVSWDYHSYSYAKYMAKTVYNIEDADFILISECFEERAYE
jgi:hypothetical protein